MAEKGILKEKKSLPHIDSHSRTQQQGLRVESLLNKMNKHPVVYDNLSKHKFSDTNLNSNTMSGLNTAKGFYTQLGKEYDPQYGTSYINPVSSQSKRNSSVSSNLDLISKSKSQFFHQRHNSDAMNVPQSKMKLFYNRQKDVNKGMESKLKMTVNAIKQLNTERQSTSEVQNRLSQGHDVTIRLSNKGQQPHD